MERLQYVKDIYLLVTCANMLLHADRKKLPLFPAGEFRVR